MRFAQRTHKLATSATMAVAAKARALQAQGEVVIDLSVGAPDFNTPQHICEAAVKAIYDGAHAYTAVDGTTELKQAVVEKFFKENQLSYTLDEVVVSVGAKQALSSLFMALLDRGDEVLIPAPYWVSYPAMVNAADSVPVIISTNFANNYKLTPDQLESAITPKSRLLILNSPSNPSGQVYSHDELKALAQVILNYPELLVVSDDVYEHIYWGEEPFANIVMVCPELKERVVLLNSVSKTYAMTGWRLGYAAGPKALIAQMKKFQSQSVSCPCSISQAAAVAALTGDQSCVSEMRSAFKQRHDYITQALGALSGVELNEAGGAFYVLPNVQGIIDRLPGVTDDVMFADYLLSNAGIATVPGTAFGQPGHLRLSYALSQPLLEKAVDQFAQI